MRLFPFLSGMIGTSYPGWFSLVVQMLLLLTTIGPAVLAIAVTAYGAKAIKRERGRREVWVFVILMVWLIAILNHLFIVPQIPR